jgi:hypothetical protein
MAVQLQERHVSLSQWPPGALVTFSIGKVTENTLHTSHHLSGEFLCPLLDPAIFKTLEVVCWPHTAGVASCWCI